MQNTLYTADNLDILIGMNSASVDLIYLDPPFNSKRVYAAPIGTKAAGTSFKDMWTWKDVDEERLETLVEKYPLLVRYIESITGLHSNAMMAYVTYMTVRLIELHRILKDTGSLYLHVDPTASHYLKVVLDFIFGKNNFRNEIVWCYDRWDAFANKFQSTHDNILFYAKSHNTAFNVLKEIDVRRQKTIDRGYTTNLLKDGTRQLIIYEGSENKENIKKLLQKDKFDKHIFKSKKDLKRPMKDYWLLNIIHPKAKERTGYPTQKPLALLERIIKASSKAGDVVLDPFCGCATTCVKAQQLGRNWIGIDIEKKAADILLQRLTDDAGLFKDFIQTALPPTRTDIITVKRDLPTKEKLYNQQAGKCNGCANEMRLVDFEIDHIIPKSKGGGDYFENYQLLCGNCNKTKGNRPMEYLRTKIKSPRGNDEKRHYFWKVNLNEISSLCKTLYTPQII